MSDTESESSEDEARPRHIVDVADDPYVTYNNVSKNPMSKKDIINKEESESSYHSVSESDISYNSRRPTRRRRYD